MKVSGHAKVSALLGITICGISGSATGGLTCFISGVLVDADHLIDYAINYRIPLKSFLNYSFVKGIFFDGSDVVGRRFREWRRNWNGPLRSSLIFHSIELVLLQLALFSGIGQPQMGLAIAVGIMGHLVSDYATWDRSPLVFSLIYRAHIGFDLDEEHYFRQKMINAGIEVTRCFECGREGGTEIHWEGVGLGYKSALVEEFEALCPECHDRRHLR